MLKNVLSFKLPIKFDIHSSNRKHCCNRDQGGIVYMSDQARVAIQDQK